MTLQLTNIGKKYNKYWVVRDVNLDVANGEIMALLGPSGCGKSTTLRMIAGLDNPDEGKIYIDNEDVTSLKPVKRGIGMVFQSYALFPHLSVSENLMLGLKVRGVEAREIRRRVENVISLMKLVDFKHVLPSKLSGGQRQRIALARALLRDPNVYLLDEPMSNLDAQLREDLRPELRSIILNENKPVVYVTHDQHEAMALANKIAIIHNGSIEQIGTPQEIYSTPNTLFVASFIGTPKINTIKSENDVIRTIRPEDIYFSKEGVQAKLIASEWLGKNQMHILETSLGQLRMLCKSTEKIPENIYLDWNKNLENRFSSKTELRI